MLPGQKRAQNKLPSSRRTRKFCTGIYRRVKKHRPTGHLPPWDEAGGYVLHSLFLQPLRDVIRDFLPVFLTDDEMGTAGEFFEVRDGGGAFVFFVIGFIILLFAMKKQKTEFA